MGNATAIYCLYTSWHWRQRKNCASGGHMVAERRPSKGPSFFLFNVWLGLILLRLRHSLQIYS